MSIADFSQQSLNIIVLNEKNSPEVMPYNYTTVEFYREILDYQFNFLFKNKKTKGKIAKLRNLLKCIESSRIEFMIKSYLRCRLWKIERLVSFFNYYDHDNTKFLHSEGIYFNQYKKLFWSYVGLIKNSQILTRASPPTRNLLTRLNLFELRRDYCHDKHVLFRVAKLDLVIESFTKTLNFGEIDSNSIYCMKFESVRHLVVSNSVLIL